MFRLRSWLASFLGARGSRLILGLGACGLGARRLSPGQPAPKAGPVSPDQWNQDVGSDAASENHRDRLVLRVGWWFSLKVTRKFEGK